jgi:hypothetical protein
MASSKVLRSPITLAAREIDGLGAAAKPTLNALPGSKHLALFSVVDGPDRDGIGDATRDRGVMELLTSRDVSSSDRVPAGGVRWSVMAPHRKRCSQAKVMRPLAEASPRYITEDALDQIRDIAPGWDRQWLLTKYKEWRTGKPEPQDPDKAFLGWVRKFTKGKPPE